MTITGDSAPPYRKQSGPRTRLRAHLGQMDGAYAKIAHWLLNLPPDSPDNSRLTSGEIARQLAASRATVVRLCKYLGYEGFSDFKAAWIHETASLTDNQPATQLLPKVAAQVADMTARSINESLVQLDVSAFNRAVAALCAASMVLVFGYIDSYYLAESVEHKLTRAAKRAKAVHHSDEIQTQAHMMNPGDVVIAISQSGDRPKVIDSLRQLRHKGCILITITSQVRSLLAEEADILLLTAARDATVADLPITFRAPQAMLLDMLILQMVANLGTPSMHLQEPKSMPAPSALASS